MWNEHEWHKSNQVSCAPLIQRFNPRAQLGHK